MTAPEPRAPASITTSAPTIAIAPDTTSPRGFATSSKPSTPLTGRLAANRNSVALGPRGRSRLFLLETLDISPCSPLAAAWVSSPEHATAQRGYARGCGGSRRGNRNRSDSGHPAAASAVSSAPASEASLGLGAGGLEPVEGQQVVVERLSTAPAADWHSLGLGLCGQHSLVRGMPLSPRGSAGSTQHTPPMQSSVQPPPPPPQQHGLPHFQPRPCASARTAIPFSGPAETGPWAQQRLGAGFHPCGPLRSPRAPPHFLQQPRSPQHLRVGTFGPASPVSATGAALRPTPQGAAQPPPPPSPLPLGTVLGSAAVRRRRSLQLAAPPEPLTDGRPGTTGSRHARQWQGLGNGQIGARQAQPRRDAASGTASSSVPAAGGLGADDTAAVSSSSLLCWSPPASPPPVLMLHSEPCASFGRSDETLTSGSLASGAAEELLEEAADAGGEPGPASSFAAPQWQSRPREACGEEVAWAEACGQEGRAGPDGSTVDAQQPGVAAAAALAASPQARHRAAHGEQQPQQQLKKPQSLLRAMYIGAETSSAAPSHCASSSASSASSRGGEAARVHSGWGQPANRAQLLVSVAAPCSLPAGAPSAPQQDTGEPAACVAAGNAQPLGTLGAEPLVSSGEPAVSPPSPVATATPSRLAPVLLPVPGSSAAGGFSSWVLDVSEPALALGAPPPVAPAGSIADDRPLRRGASGPQALQATRLSRGLPLPSHFPFHAQHEQFGGGGAGSGLAEGSSQGGWQPRPHITGYPSFQYGARPRKATSSREATATAGSPVGATAHPHVNTHQPWRHDPAVEAWPQAAAPHLSWRASVPRLPAGADPNDAPVASSGQQQPRPQHDGESSASELLGELEGEFLMLTHRCA
ncbi:hypothetical protein HYH03_014400 [Edaphochlamys debaryana]|uniref:Uncharacterized protein n=1 Tax=Edaphochlamys debaryana TaxID=47281 RepID=A0A835XNT8_9CHLO|nr:hypothetical protein HYH03_014400 [Edaphochlamys debaryana]|eukprot:KAG2486900.1 hypothetical protein HYH03_014400 [Edaphochlamys debaryana]